MADYLQIVARNILHRRLRSWLTVVGMVMGVAAIVSLVLLSQGLQNAIREQFEQFGTDKVIVLPAGFQGQVTSELNRDDVKALESIPEIAYAAPLLGQQMLVEFEDEKKLHVIYAWPAELSEQLGKDFGLGARTGKWFVDDTNDVVIGSRVEEGFFKEKVRLNNRIIINGQKFTVRGILEPVGNPEDDSAMYMPLALMRGMLDKPEEVSFIQVKLKKGADPDEVAKKMEARLERVRSRESFDVSTAEQFLEQLGAVLSIVQGVLVGIATISLVVGAVGIATSMYTSVIERTREIGIMKALGATNVQVLLIFIAEAGVLGLVGGVIGFGLGTLTALGVAQLAEEMGFDILRIVVSPVLVVFSLVFAMGIGMLAGVLPARQAALLKPVEAMRRK